MRAEDRATLAPSYIQSRGENEKSRELNFKNSFSLKGKPIGALPLRKCCFSHSLLWLCGKLGGMGGGGLKKGLKKGGNALRATESQRCKYYASC